MGTHLIISIVLGLASLFIGLKTPKNTQYSFIFFPVFVIVIAIGLGVSYIYSFPLSESQDILTTWSGPVFLGIIFSIILGLPFMINYSEIAFKFIGITLFLSFTIGLWIFSGIFVAFTVSFGGFFMGLLSRSRN